MSASEYAAAYAAQMPPPPVEEKAGGPGNYAAFFPGGAAAAPQSAAQPAYPDYSQQQHASQYHQQQQSAQQAQQAQAYHNYYAGYQQQPPQQLQPQQQHGGYAQPAWNGYGYAAPAQPHAPPPPPASAYGHYPQQAAQHHPQSAYPYSGAAYPPPPPAPVAPPVLQKNPATGNYAPNYDATQTHVPSLSSSFVAATSSELSSTPSAIAAPARGPTSRGPIDLTASASPPAPAPAPVAAPGGIQFTIAGAGAAKRSRWGGSSALKPDTTESTLVSQTAVPAPAPAPVAPQHNAYQTQYAQQQYAQYANYSGAAAAQPSPTAYGAYPQQQPQQQQYQQYQYAAYPSAASTGYAATTSYSAAPSPAAASAAGASSSFTQAMLAYVERSLADPTCPISSRPAVEQFLAAKLDRFTKDPKLAQTVDWVKEPLAYGQMNELSRAATAASYARKPNMPFSYAAAAGAKTLAPAGSGSNNTPLGVRGATGAESKEDATMNDDADYIPFGKGGAAAAASTAAAKKEKKRARAAEAAAWTAGLEASAATKKQRKFSAADQSKVADRASRFASYNAEVAQSLETFKNPIQRHLFTADQSDDVELDWSQLHIRGTCEKLEKRYLRLTQAPDPASVRPERVLMRSLDFILRRWRGEPDVESPAGKRAPAIKLSVSAAPAAVIPLRDYKYTCEQLKSIRQDLTVQNLRSSPLTVLVYESHARIALAVGDYSEYNQCQTQLRSLYTENPTLQGNQAEFVGYRILYNLITGNRAALMEMMREIQNQRMDQARTTGALVEPLLGAAAAAASPISLAFAVSLAALQGDYFTFFRLYPGLPHQGPAILAPFASALRFQALTQLIRAFRPGKLEAAFFQRALALSEEEATRYLRDTGVVVVDGIVDTRVTELHEIEETEADSAAQAHGVTHALL